MQVDHTTVFRWVQRYVPELDKRCRPQLKATNDSCMDETYIRINKQWYDLYRAVDSRGAALDFMLSPARDAEAAEHFFRQVLQASHTLTPRVISIDKNAAYPPAFESLQQEKTLPEACQLRPCKYLSNAVEQDHRFINRRLNPGLGFGAFATAQMSSPRTASSTSCSGWPHNESSPASPHPLICFCNTTAVLLVSWRTRPA